MYKKSFFCVKCYVMGVFAVLSMSSFAFQFESQISPECRLLTTSQGYSIHFDLPDYHYELQDDDRECDNFYDIVMDDEIMSDYLDASGCPELPFFSYDLIIPEDANVFIGGENFYTASNYLDGYITPSLFDDPDDDRCMEEAYYNGSGGYQIYEMALEGGYYAANNYYYTLSDVYYFNGFFGVTLTIFPFFYFPRDNYMEVVSSLELEIVVEGGKRDLIAMIEELQYPRNVNELSAALFYDNLNNSDINEVFLTNSGSDIKGIKSDSKNQFCPEIINTGKRGKYLIVAPNRAMEEILCPYISHKQSQNYHVDVTYLNEEGYTWTHFSQAYDYVLLIGSLSDYPFYGEGFDPYGSRVGRWVINYGAEEWEEDLVRVIEKSLSAETSYSSLPTHAVLFSGWDDKRRRRRRWEKHLRKLERKAFDKMGTGSSNYGLSDANTLESALQEDPRFFIYNGHGSYYNIGSPYQDIDQEWLNGAYAPNPYTFGFGFACKLNSLNEYPFGAQWINSHNEGGVGFYGSSLTTYDSPDNRLSINMFKMLRKMTNRSPHNFPIGMLINNGEMKYFNALRTGRRREQVQKYNLMGDPTIFVYGMDAQGNPMRKTKGHDNKIRNTETTKNIGKHDVYDIRGNLLQTLSSTQQVSEIQLPVGVYVIRTVYDDGSFSTKKLIR